MSKTLQSLFLGALIATASSAIAQETNIETPSIDPNAADPAADLSMGQPVLEIGQPYFAEQNGDWALRCLKAAEGQPDPCQLYQLLLDENGNEVAEFSMFPLPAGSAAAAGATIVVPLETLLTQQLTLSVDGSATRRYPFTFCTRAGCVAQVGFTQEEVDQFKRGNTANLRMVPAAARDQEVNLTISLSGFTAGFDNSVANVDQ